MMGCEQRNSLCRLIELSNQGRVQQKAPPGSAREGGGKEITGQAGTAICAALQAGSPVPGTPERLLPVPESG